MENNQSDSTYEYQRLAKTISIAKEEFKQAKLSNDNNKAAIIEAKREMRENATHSVSGLWSQDGFEDLVALSQYVNPILNKFAEYEETENRIAILKKIMDSPYFARIDFKFEDEDTFEKIYIGRASLKKTGSFERYVYDWRSPIASMFYRFTIGPAYYEAPAGKITGEINLKRQYEIKNGTLEYFFDADVQILDEFLRKLLSQNTSSKMKSIVETIQKEQDIIIRDMENELMMVQGVAGSGKTSIALHRAAYLMYQGLSSKLTANNIIIISPNAVFEQYISNVLPELGEDHVISVVFEEMLITILQKKRIQTRNQFLELLITNPRYQNIMKSSIEFKTSHQFLEILIRLMKDLPQNIASNTESLYRKLFEDENYFFHLAKDLELPDCMRDILTYTKENLSTKTLYYDDAAALAFLELKINGSEQYKNIKQVVIDEAQDYYPLHFELLNLLFPYAKYTVLGDINQTLEKEEDISLYEQINTILNKRRSTFVIMDKSFRCTNEILTFSSQFIPQSVEIKSFNRAGYEPELHVASNRTHLCNMIIAEIRFCLEQGYQSIGLICKTEKESTVLFKYLKEKVDVQVIKNEGTADLRGVFIIPVYMSKGLEFDAVLICDADYESYKTKEDQKLLYIACTRALHRLNLFCNGEASPLLKPI